MPQFDSTFFPSQVFWLLVCFAVLYFAMSKIYLPRITSIIKERKKAIEHDSLLSQQLNHKIALISENTTDLRNRSFAQYQTTLDQAAKEASLRREQALSELRKKTDLMTAQTEKRITDFIQNSKDNSEGVIKNLVDLLSKKIFDNPTSINHINE